MTQYKWLPSEPTDEMLVTVESNIKPAVISIYERMWKDAPEVEQEPVAVVRRYRDGTKAAEIYDRSMEEGTKLYTHPQREPLSYEKVLELKKKCTNGGGSVVDYFMFATELEKAHGIGG